MGKKLFDYAIGNPPYQTTQNGRELPVYDSFMDEVYKVASVTELITPARFLFNAGQTHKDWNDKMLQDKHLKVLSYEADASKVFPDTDIKGGVAVTLHDDDKNFGAIGVFVPSPIMRSVLSKVKERDGFESLTDIICTSTKYALSSIYKDHPDYKRFVKSDGKHSQIDTNVFGKMPIFERACPAGSEDEYVQMYGRYNNQREYWWVREEYIADSGNLFKYKVFVSKANGSGDFGIALSQPTIGDPRVGSTQSFLGIGALDSREDATRLLAYLKTKFARAMLCTLKITQDNGPEKWSNIPLQDFTASSDIDWFKPIQEIDRQLYAKYGLSQEEIEFIETYVKAME